MGPVVATCESIWICWLLWWSVSCVEKRYTWHVILSDVEYPRGLKLYRITDDEQSRNTRQRLSYSIHFLSAFPRKILLSWENSLSTLSFYLVKAIDYSAAPSSGIPSSVLLSFPEKIIINLLSFRSELSNAFMITRLSQLLFIYIYIFL